MSEVKEETKDVEKPVLKSKTEVLNALRGNFATSVKRIYINSLKEEVAFREIKVSE